MTPVLDKEYIDKFNSILEPYEGKAILGGGCVRDALLGRPVRDYDIYIQHSDAQDLGLEFQYMESTYEEYTHQYICARGEPAEDIDLIVISDDIPFKYIIDGFNFGVCQASYSVTDGLYTSMKFITDAMISQITLTRSDWGLLGSFHHLARLQQKYNWPVRVES